MRGHPASSHPGRLSNHGARAFGYVWRGDAPRSLTPPWGGCISPPSLPLVVGRSYAIGSPPVQVLETWILRLDALAPDFAGTHAISSPQM